jgi:hypothetical protein
MKKKVFAWAVIVIVASPAFANNSKASKETPASVLTGWMQLHARMVRDAKGVAHVSFSRHFSYAAIAAYESIVASDASYRSLGGQLNGLQTLPTANKNEYYWPASLNAAYAQVMRKYYASFGMCSARIDSMEAAQTKVFEQLKVAAAILNKSAGYGKRIAAIVLQWAEEDGAVSQKTYTPLTGDGVWKPATVAAMPFWAEKRSLIKNTLDVFAIKPPVYAAGTEGMFYKMANEVYTASVNLTPEQRAIALHWDDNPNGKYMSGFGHWAYILSGLVKQYKLPLLKAAEAYVRMSIAMHEASILAWKGKYQYNVVRPITFIQQHISNTWQPLISTPPHPEFPAAHATISTAAAVALTAVFGENCAVTDDSYTDIGMQPRSFTSLRSVSTEAGISRLYGGIHYRYSIEQGAMLGEAAANYMNKSIRFH